MSARPSGTTASLERGEKSLNIQNITNQTSEFGPRAYLEFTMVSGPIPDDCVDW
jgi:hypothetical protein